MVEGIFFFISSFSLYKTVTTTGKTGAWASTWDTKLIKIFLNVKNYLNVQLFVFMLIKDTMLQFSPRASKASALVTDCIKIKIFFLDLETNNNINTVENRNIISKIKNEISKTLDGIQSWYANGMYF